MNTKENTYLQKTGSFLINNQNRKETIQKIDYFFVFIARFENHLSSIFSANNMYKVLLIFEILWYTMNVKNQKGVSLWKSMLSKVATDSRVK